VKHLALDPAFRAWLLGHVDVAERELDKVVAELMDHWSETDRDWVLRRHRELMKEGLPARLVYGHIRAELEGRRFAPRPMSERQIRRLIYG
jgi:hypothetical protein